ncbi:MAG: hypothetical protein AAB502_03270 [Chloroflexota bacterium]
MERQAVVLMPYAEETAARTKALAARLDSLQGKTIGIINNGWNCMNVTTDEIRRLLVSDYGVADVIEKKTTASLKLPKPELEDMARRADAVICGMGN